MALRYSGGFGKPPSYNYAPEAAPHATGGKVQPASPRGKTIKVKAHTRVKPPKKAPAAPNGGTPAPTGDQKLINAAVRSRFAPQEQALNAGLAQNTRFSNGVGDWYSNALADIKGLQAQGNAQAQDTLGRITAYNSQPALQNATDQQAAGARNNLNSEYAAMFGRDATANSDAMNRLAAAYAIQQGNTQNQANAQRQQLLTQQGQLGQQKADYGLQYGAQLQTAENKALTDQAKLDIASKALGLKVDTLNKVQIPLAKSLNNDRTNKQKVARTNARTKRETLTHQEAVDRHDSMLNDKKFQLDRNKYGLDAAKQKYKESHPSVSEQKSAVDLKYFKKHGYYPPTGPPKTGANAKPTQGQTKTATAILDATARYRNGISHGQSLQDIANEGRNHGVSETMIEIASYLATHNNKPNHSVLRKMKTLGVTRQQLGI